MPCATVGDSDRNQKENRDEKKRIATRKRVATRRATRKRIVMGKFKRSVEEVAWFENYVWKLEVRKAANSQLITKIVDK